MMQVRAIGIADEHAPQLSLAFDEQGCCTMTDARDKLLNCLKDEEEAAAYLSTLVPWSVKCMGQRLTQCAWREIPVIYIHTTQNFALDLAAQRMMGERVQEHGLKDAQIIFLDMDHSPHVTATEDLIDIVNKGAAEV